MKDFIKEHLSILVATLITASVSGFGGWLYGREKLDAEIQKLKTEVYASEIENKNRIVVLYREAMDDLNQRYEAKFTEMTQLYEHKINLLKEEIILQDRQIQELKQTIANYKNKEP